MLVGAFCLARHLWHSVAGFARAAGDAGAALGQATVAISDAVEQSVAEAARREGSPTMFDDVGVITRRYLDRNERVAQRIDARRERWRKTAAAWPATTDEYLIRRRTK